DLAEQRPFAQDKVVFFAVKNVSAGHVRGKQVRRELDALVLRPQHTRKRLRQSCFGDAGHAFEQDVAAGQQGDEELVRDRFHADHYAGHFGQSALAKRTNLVGQFSDDLSVGTGVESAGHACRPLPSMSSNLIVPSANALLTVSTWSTRRLNS